MTRKTNPPKNKRKYLRFSSGILSRSLSVKDRTPLIRPCPNSFKSIFITVYQKIEFMKESKTPFARLVRQPTGLLNKSIICYNWNRKLEINSCPGFQEKT
jgi:hypothetical protein